MNNFFTTRLMGGLGNQMFQISHAICQGWKFKVDVVFDKQSFIPLQGKQPRSYSDNIFRNIRFEKLGVVSEICSEKNWNNTNLNFNPKNSVGFIGYFQGSNYFLGYNEKIKKLFLPHEIYIEKILKLFPELMLSGTTSIHVRRGDYLKFPKKHPTIDISYIEKSLSQIQNKSKIFLFTDDKEWAQKNFKKSEIEIVYNLQDWEELWMMSLCKNNIMSNSTFSWWASFLNKNSDQEVFVPSLWFGPEGPQNFENMYEKNWNKIDVEIYNGKLVCN